MGDTWASLLTRESAHLESERTEARVNSPVAWEFPVWEVFTRWHRNGYGQRMDVQPRPYQEGILKSWGPAPRQSETVVKKCPQEGVSEIAVSVALTFGGWFGGRVWYVITKNDARDDFVSNRVDPAVQYVPEYRDRIQAAVVLRDNTRLKHLAGGGFIKFAGSNVRGDFLTHPCDLAITDELNECNLDHVALLDDRMSGLGAWGVHLKISTPTQRGFGISAEYERSDRQRWHVPCPSCGEPQVLDWWTNVMEPGSQPDTWRLRDRTWAEGCGRDIRLFCRKCEATMDRFAMGEWIPERPERRVKGFHISKLMSAARPVSIMFEKYRDMVEDVKPGAGPVFYNSILGEDYTGGKVQVTEELLRYCAELDPYRMPDRMKPRGGRTVAGVDVGKRLHVVIDLVEGRRRRAVFIGTCEPKLSTLANLFDQYGVSLCVVDSQDITFSMNARERFNTSSHRMLFACRYQMNRLTRPDRDDAEAIVSIDRTMALDESKADMDTSRRLLPQNVMNLDGGEFKTSMTGPVRRDEKYKQGGVDKTRTIWTKVPGDHYRHADTYAWIASTLLPPRAPVDWGGEDDDEGGRTFTGPDDAALTSDWGIGGGDDGGRVFG